VIQRMLTPSAVPAARQARQILATTLHSDWSQFEPLAALRCTCGVAIPLVLGVSSGWPSVGVFAAVGAVSVGFGSFQGTYRGRAAVMLWAAIGMAVSIVLGSLAGHSGAAATLVATLWGFASGWLVALGPAASFVGLQSAVAAIIAQGFAANSTDAFLRGVIVFGGGLIQTLLVVTIWPLRRYPAERAAIGAIYRSLARYADAIPSLDNAPPEPNTLVAAAATLRDPQPFARSTNLLAFRALIDEAERVRVSLAALALQHRRLKEAGDDRRLAASAGLATEVACVLDEIGRAVEAGVDPEERPSCWSAIDAHAAELDENPAVSGVLPRRLHAAWRTSGVLSSDRLSDPTTAVVRTVPLLRLPPVRDALNTLRANLSFQSAAFRHGVRLAITLAFTTAVYHVLSLPRGYWITLTALIVLKPEFQDTFARGVGRMAGTVVGATLATLLAATLRPGHATLIVLVLACVWCCYAVFRINYVVFSICITTYVVFLMDLAGVNQSAVVTNRVVDTMLGGVAALVAYAVWPTWTGTRVRTLLGELLEAHARYAGALLNAMVDPSIYDARSLFAMRSAGRLARSNAEAAVDRMLREPGAFQPIDPQTAVGVLAALRRSALAALALEAALEEEPRRALPWLTSVATSVPRLFRDCAASVREGVPPPAPSFVLRRPTDATAGERVVFEEVEMLADSAATVATVLAALGEHDRAGAGTRE
jgi:uncharacterized membrane protein YccC